MRSIKYKPHWIFATVMVIGLGVTSPIPANAARPRVERDSGAFVRLVGNPSEGTAKFQFGWAEDTDASNAAGYWIGLYDETNLQYVWSYDTGPKDLASKILRNAKPTPELPNGEYKVVFFVRGTYGPETNIAEIELFFTVNA